MRVFLLIIVDESQKKIQEKYLKHHSKFIADKEREEKRRKKEEDLKKENLKRLTPSVKEISAEEAERLKKLEQGQSHPQIQTNNNSTNTTSSNTTTTTTTTTSTSVSKPKEETKKKEEKKDEKEKEKPNSLNGGSAPRYLWTQKLEDIQMQIPVDTKYHGKDISVKYKAKSLFVGIKNGETIIDGEFLSPIKVNFLF